MTHINIIMKSSLNPPTCTRRLAANAKGIQASLPCCQKQQKAAAIKNTTASLQLLAELQSHLSPKPVKELQETASVTVEFTQVNMGSQLTCGTDFPSNKSEGNNDSESSDEVNGAAASNQ